jgi:SAM-dependent methyltransferase
VATPESNTHGFEATLDRQRAAWDARPLVRHLYNGWYERIVGALSPVDGPTVELGCGIGTFKEHYPRAVATDVADQPWAEAVVDAENMPYGDHSVANLVLVDVLHHVPNPAAFFAEAERTLVAGGRVIVVEPYCSPVSYRAYRRFHHEVTDLDVDPFASAQSEQDPFDSNQALPTLFFWRCRSRFRSLHPELHIIRAERFGLFTYPLSGGFTGRPLLPPAVGQSVQSLERLVERPLGRLLAFRCLVALERR